jgi:hypothetical protein
MQRWIVAAVVFAVLAVSGAGIGYWKYREYKQNKPDKIWLPIPTKPELSLEQRQEVVTLLTEKLGELPLLTKVSKDSGYAKDMGLATDEAGAKDLKQRLFIEVGIAETTGGKVPSINVGFHCKKKEFDKMKKVTNRLMADIGIILGLPAPKRAPF